MTWMLSNPTRTGRAPGVVAALALVLLLGASPAQAQEPAATPGTTMPSQRLTTPILSARRLPDLLRSRIADAQLTAAVQDVVDQAPDTSCLSVSYHGRAVFDHNESLPVEPASTNKLLTSYAILQEMGADERLSTTAVASGPADGGVIQGDLWIVGGGDAMLNTDGYRMAFDDANQPVNDPDVLADRIAAAGITEITGNIVGDDTRYDDQRAVATWPERYRREDTVGSLSALVVNHGVTGYAESPDRASANRQPGDPPLLAAQTFETLLEARGVAVRGIPATGRAPATTTEIARLDSAPLGDIITETLAWSDNTTAELLTKELGFRASGSGTTAAGTRATLEHLEASGLPTAGVVINDGSGLDVDNRLTCSLLVDLLDAEGPDSVIGRGMAVSGERGTLRKRMGGPSTQGRVAAKTGTLTTPPVASLAGFVTTANDEVVTFAFIQNGIGTDASVQDQLALALVDYPQAPTLAELGPRPPSPP